EPLSYSAACQQQYKKDDAAAHGRFSCFRHIGLREVQRRITGIIEKAGRAGTTGKSAEADPVKNRHIYQTRFRSLIRERIWRGAGLKRRKNRSYTAEGRQ